PAPPLAGPDRPLRGGDGLPAAGPRSPARLVDPGPTTDRVSPVVARADSRPDRARVSPSGLPRADRPIRHRAPGPPRGGRGRGARKTGRAVGCGSARGRRQRGGRTVRPGVLLPDLLPARWDR